MAEADGEPGQVERWFSVAATIIAPATVLSAVLFYFGYVSARAQYEYFGVDVDTIGLSTRDYVMRSPQPLLVPVLVLTLLGIGMLLAHTAISRRVAAAGPDDHDGERYLEFARIVVRFGLGVLVAGVVLLFSYPLLREWSFYNLVTPLVLTVGAAVVAYASRIQTRLLGRDRPAGTGRAAAADRSMVTLRRVAGVLIFVVIVANIFWATATVAQWSGRGLAHYDARHLDRLPSVILDTTERLYLRDPAVTESELPAEPGQDFRYRYRGLRLLIQGGNRMFLVPQTWSASDSTLVVALDGSVRVQFQFQNEAP